MQITDLAKQYPELTEQLEQYVVGRFSGILHVNAVEKEGGFQAPERDDASTFLLLWRTADGWIVDEECCNRYCFPLPPAQKVKGCCECSLCDARGGMVSAEQGCHGVLDQPCLPDDLCLFHLPQLCGDHDAYDWGTCRLGAWERDGPGPDR